MTKNLQELISECCICREWKDAKGVYYMPKVEERRDAYKNHKQISHGMCGPCYILWEERELN